MQVQFTVNGRAASVDVPPNTLLVHALREHLLLTGTHVGCDTSQCGACTVHAPHWLVSHPTWVPVSSRCSRSAWTSRVLGGTSTLAARPLTVNWTCIWLSPGVVLAG